MSDSVEQEKTPKAREKRVIDYAKMTQLEWDNAIRKVTVTQSGAATAYYYDLLGYTYRIVYANGLEEWYYRDERKNITQHIHPNAGISSSVYDADDQLTCSTNPDGGQVHFQYMRSNN